MSRRRRRPLTPESLAQARLEAEQAEIHGHNQTARQYLGSPVAQISGLEGGIQQPEPATAPERPDLASALLQLRRIQQLSDPESSFADEGMRSTLQGQAQELLRPFEAPPPEWQGNLFEEMDNLEAFMRSGAS